MPINEKLKLENMFKEFLLIQENAVKVVKQHIIKFEADGEDNDNNDKKQLIQGLIKGLQILQSEYELYKNEDTEKLDNMLKTHHSTNLMQVEYFIHLFRWYKGDWVQNIREAVRDIQRYFNNFFVANISESEKIELQEKLNIMLSLKQEAIKAIKKYLIILEKNIIANIGLINDLTRALSNIESAYEINMKEGIGGIAAVIRKYPRGRRPGLGLTRGFDEILMQKEEVEKEIMNAVRKIEHYFASM